MESLGPDLTPTEVARKYAITTGLLYTWRRQVLGGQMTDVVRSTPGFAPVEVVLPHVEAPEPKPEPPIAPPTSAIPPRPEGLIEIMLADGVTVRVDAHALRRVLDAVADR